MAQTDVSVVADPAQIRRIERMVAGIKNGLPRVLVRALNKVGRSARTGVVRFLAKRSGMKQKDLRRSVTLKPANYRSLAANLRVRGRPVRLIRLAARGPEPSRGRGKGVSYRDPATGGRRTLPHAFIATMQTGHRGVFSRVAAGRLPIREEYGPSVVETFLPEVTRVKGETGEKLRREVDVQARLVVERSK